MLVVGADNEELMISIQKGNKTYIFIEEQKTREEVSGTKTPR